MTDSGTGLSGRWPAVAALFCIPLMLACTPRVEVAAPEKPITINLNIKLDANVRVQLEEAADKDIKANPELF